MSQLRFARILGFLFYYSSGKLLRVSPNYLNGRNPRDIRRRHAYMNMNMYKKRRQCQLIAVAERPVRDASLNISPSHSRTIEITPLCRTRVSSY